MFRRYPRLLVRHTRRSMRSALTELIRPPRTAVLSSAAVGVATLALSRRAGPTRVPWVVPWVTAGLAAAHVLDAEHFVRVLVQDVRHLLCERNDAAVLAPDRRLYRCLPVDIDQNGHMNNAKFLRVLNYSRRSFWQRNGVWRHCLRRAPRANMVVTASTIRYRREIRCWQRFAVVSRLVQWDGQCFYVESRLESLAQVEGMEPFVLAVSFVKYRVLSDDKLRPDQLLQAVDPERVPAQSPVATPDLQAWQAYDRASSAALRPAAAL